MKCHICNKTMTSDEIKFEKEDYGRGGFAPCSTCLEITDNLFSDLTEEEIIAEIEYETAQLYYEEIEDVAFDVSETT